MSAEQNGIILYHYSFSPFARRVVWYLALRGIDYAQCIQPPVLPRPDINALGIAYRRIPLLSIGGDVYCDTRLILKKLEKTFPNGALSVSEPDQKALQILLEKWTVEIIFTRAGQLIPPELPLLKDPKFQEDRKDFSGRSWDRESMEAMRPEALTHIREGFLFLETTLLADERDWILKTERPSLADIEAIWPFHWLVGLKGALPRDQISPDHFPRVFGWIKRFDEVVKAAQAALPKPTTLTGPEAQERLFGARVTADVHVQEDDPSKLNKGQSVEVWPLDTGFRHKDRGVLIGLSEEEIVLEVQAPKGGKLVHLHVPRLNYRLRAIPNLSAARL